LLLRVSEHPVRNIPSLLLLLLLASSLFLQLSLQNKTPDSKSDHEILNWSFWFRLALDGQHNNDDDGVSGEISDAFVR
jgi:hypothetical protein